MEPVVKLFTAIVGVGLVTTLILPGRQTPEVFRAFGDLFSKSLGTAMGR
jgi:hypothetical protein